MNPKIQDILTTYEEILAIYKRILDVIEPKPTYYINSSATTITISLSSNQSTTDGFYTIGGSSLKLQTHHSA